MGMGFIRLIMIMKDDTSRKRTTLTVQAQRKVLVLLKRLKDIHSQIEEQ